MAQPGNDPVRALLAPQLRSAIDAVRQAQADYDAAPKYNFMRRNRGKAALDKAVQDFSSAAERAIREYEQKMNAGYIKLASQKNDIEADIARLQRERTLLYLRFTDRAGAEIDGIMRSVEADRSATDAEMDRLAGQLKQQTNQLEKNNRIAGEALASVTAINEALKQLESRRNVDAATLKKLPAAAGRVAADVNRAYEAAAAGRLKLENNIKAIPDYAKKLNDLEGGIPDDATERALVTCADIIATLSAASVEREVFDARIEEEYKKFRVKYTRSMYRHKLYFKLLFAALYYSRPALPDNFLNIDEAQDISVVEYNLLNRILGPRCCYNLYGDVNQAVYSFKGIQVWEEDIPQTVRGNVYMLNENYRNTLQITEYCNRAVGSEMTAIGINGEAVAEVTLSDAAARIAAYKKANPAARIAVIYRHGAEGVLEKLKSGLSGIQCEWSGVDTGRVSVITTEISKGLEFEYVVAVTPGMSENERYVAYTRALDALVAVNEL